MNKIEPASPVCYAPEDRLFACAAPQVFNVEPIPQGLSDF